MSRDEMFELVGIIDKISDEIFYTFYEKEEETESYEIIMSTNGDFFSVDFLGIQIWNSEDDCRELDESDEYEPLEPYLRKKINEHIRKLKMISL